MAAFVFVPLFAIIAAAWIQLVKKAGYSRVWVFLPLLIGPLAVLVVILKEWPVHRELGWRRFLDGSTSDDLVEMVERYALDLEQAGDWKQATRVYQELARRIPESAEYYAKSASRFASPPPLLWD
ncbi:hypothetical protein [Paludisphaera rhizosphaerae]|uniref:hypothetical protein n=1 Tax=Paludisphaera rhizosphaerae TaxID=2711216 RepID=UPI0013EDF4BA|nr:hypothetical protein [Paludisphaera rhizosphaerae]